MGSLKRPLHEAAVLQALSFLGKLEGRLIGTRFMDEQARNEHSPNVATAVLTHHYHQ